MYRTWAYKLYWTLEQRIDPGLKSSQYRYHNAVSKTIGRNARWLDLGCGHQVFADWMIAEEQEIISRTALFVGIDLDARGIRAHRHLRNRVLGPLTNLPFADNSFDVLTANMVVEHLDDPLAVLREAHRVLVPGGRFVFHTPNSKSFSIRAGSWLPQFAKNRVIAVLEGRHEEDVFKTFYRMNTATAVADLGAKAGFKVATTELWNSSAVTVMLGPLVVFELIALRILDHPRCARYRSNLVGILEKQA
jgi:ubiquinone/menaquinone biosynthesis C-methylase UbiE